MKRLISFAAIVQIAVLVGCIGTTSTAAAQDTPEGHVLLNASDISWGPAPASLPPGAQASVLEGDPTVEGPFTLRLRMPANYRIPPHWHPGIEHVTVLSGTFNLGLGETVDEDEGHALTAGGFMAMPPETPHYAWATEETVIQLHGMGPWGITYINEEDDPRQ